MLLLDEPTKGLDAYMKLRLADLLRALAGQGRAVIAVSHDVEFAAMISTSCALLFDGALLAAGEPHAFFSGNTFYTTAAARMAAGAVPGAIFVDEIATALSVEH